MSENAGLQTVSKGSSVPHMKEVKRPIPKVYRIKDRSRVFKVSQKVLEQQARSEQQSLEDLRYCPVTRSQKHADSYDPVPAPEYSEAIKRTFKKDKFRPSVSFIPQTTLLEDQPAVNIAEPVYPQLGFNPMNEVPDLTVANGLSEDRRMRASNRRLASMLDSRAMERSRARFVMRSVEPDRPYIVDVNKHRMKNRTLQQSTEEIHDRTRKLVKKLFRPDSVPFNAGD